MLFASVLKSFMFLIGDLSLVVFLVHRVFSWDVRLLWDRLYFNLGWMILIVMIRLSRCGARFNFSRSYSRFVGFVINIEFFSL